MSRPRSVYYDLMFRIVDGKTLATKEYSTFQGFKSRIKSQKRGYEHLNYDPVFDAPEGFKAFLDDVGFAPSSNHTLDRVDNKCGYVLGNLKWSTYSENLRNRRVTLHVTDGINTWPMIEFCEIHTLNYLAIKQWMAHHKLKLVTVSQLKKYGYC